MMPLCFEHCPKRQDGCVVTISARSMWFLGMDYFADPLLFYHLTMTRQIQEYDRFCSHIGFWSLFRDQTCQQFGMPAQLRIQVYS